VKFGIDIGATWRLQFLVLKGLRWTAFSFIVVEKGLRWTILLAHIALKQLHFYRRLLNVSLPSLFWIVYNGVSTIGNRRDSGQWFSIMKSHVSVKQLSEGENG